MGGDFIDLIAWREAASLSADIDRSVLEFRGPLASEAIDQVVRAARSVPANIAEGHGRGVTKDCVRFLRIARSSAGEVENHLRVAGMSGRLKKETCDWLVTRSRRVRWLVHRLLLSVERRIAQPRSPQSPQSPPSPQSPHID